MVVIPSDMDVPVMRRDTTKPENVRWLLRNLGIRNSNHPMFNQTIKALAKAATISRMASELMRKLGK